MSSAAGQPVLRKADHGGARELVELVPEKEMLSIYPACGFLDSRSRRSARATAICLASGLPFLQNYLVLGFSYSQILVNARRKI